VRVLLSPRAEAIPGAREMAAALAGDEHSVVSLVRAGVNNLTRRLSPAEVHLVRRALSRAGSADGVVGYVCRGRCLERDAEGVAGSHRRLLPVKDHVNLTWISPLSGPNDEGIGPRFVPVAGIYRPQLVHSLLSPTLALEAPGVAVQVGDLWGLTGFEEQVVSGLGVRWVSDELLSVVLSAAHRGYAVAAVLLEDAMGEMGERGKDV
jgi:hypothetical protein